MFACKPSANDQLRNNEPGSAFSEGPGIGMIVSEFPASKLDQLVEGITQQDLVALAKDGESDRWKQIAASPDRQEFIIQSKSVSDNSVKFTLYRAATRALVGVQQQNAQVATNEIWEYRYTTNADHPEQWNQFLIPEYKVDSFFTERVILPEGIRGDRAEPYLEYQYSKQGLTISLNKWRFMRDLEANSMQPEGALDPARIKYRYQWNWTGEGFVEKKVNEAAYEEKLTFTTVVNEYDSTDEAGPHSFDCPATVTVTASSTLNRHKASNLLDENEATAWSESNDGDGIGEWVEFTITSNTQAGKTWQISNGYTKSKTLWEQNNRIKKFKVLVDDKFVANIVLANVFAYQSFNIAPPWLKDAPSFKKGTRIRFVVEEVYKGSKYNDAVISYFAPVGSCG